MIDNSARPGKTPCVHKARAVAPGYATSVAAAAGWKADCQESKGQLKKVRVQRMHSGNPNGSSVALNECQGNINMKGPWIATGLRPGLFQ
jgi:hypothetical protein